ncbi:MAG: hypothetical protein ABEJ83_02480 [Candidatus Nanohaloarchaea archaeon]
MTEKDFDLAESDEEKIIVQLSGSDRIVPGEKKDEEGLINESKVPEEGDIFELYTGREDLHPEFDKILEKINNPIVKLHMPVTVDKEARELIEQKREMLELVFHIDGKVEEKRKESIKRWIEDLERSDQASFRFHKESREDLMIKQLSARLPSAKIDIILEDKSKQEVKEALKLAEEILTISRIGGIGIGWSIPRSKRPHDLERKLFKNRNKQVNWLSYSLSGKQFYSPNQQEID